MTTLTANNPQAGGFSFDRLHDKILGSLATAVIGDALARGGMTRGALMVTRFLF